MKCNWVCLCQACSLVAGIIIVLLFLSGKVIAEVGLPVSKYNDVEDIVGMVGIVHGLYPKCKKLWKNEMKMFHDNGLMLDKQLKEIDVYEHKEQIFNYIKSTDISEIQFVELKKEYERGAKKYEAMNEYECPQKVLFGVLGLERDIVDALRDIIEE